MFVVRRLWTSVVLASVSVHQAYSTTQCPAKDKFSENYLTLDRERCYTVYKTPMTWREAADSCKGKGGSLARLTGRDEENIAMYMFMFHDEDVSCLWIGLSASDGTWRWLDGSKMDTSLFSSDHPGPPASCAMLCHFGKTLSAVYEISRQFCYMPVKFVCQMDDNIPTGGDDTALTNDVTTADDTTLKDAATTADNTTLMEVATTADNTTFAGYMTTSLPTLRRRSVKSNAPVTQRSSFFKNTATDSIVIGEAAFRDSTFTLSMCARLCLMSEITCELFNYNSVTRECVGFPNIRHGGLEKRKQWTVWQMS